MADSINVIYLLKDMVLLKKMCHRENTVNITAELYKYRMELGIQKSCVRQLLHAAIS